MAAKLEAEKKLTADTASERDRALNEVKDLRKLLEAANDRAALAEQMAAEAHENASKGIGVAAPTTSASAESSPTSRQFQQRGGMTAEEKAEMERLRELAAQAGKGGGMTAEQKAEMEELKKKAA